ncbi:hypothetical protein NAEX_08961 [Nannocystis exedens]|nr:hypothetical protein NAEX_08961 [Nannocystis exedens]
MAHPGRVDHRRAQQLLVARRIGREHRPHLAREAQLDPRPHQRPRLRSPRQTGHAGSCHTSSATTWYATRLPPPGARRPCAHGSGSATAAPRSRRAIRQPAIVRPVPAASTPRATPAPPPRDQRDRPAASTTMPAPRSPPRQRRRVAVLVRQRRVLAGCLFAQVLGTGTPAAPARPALAAASPPPTDLPTDQVGASVAGANARPPAARGCRGGTAPEPSHHFGASGPRPAAAAAARRGPASPPRAHGGQHRSAAARSAAPGCLAFRPGPSDSRGDRAAPASPPSTAGRRARGPRSAGAPSAPALARPARPAPAGTAAPTTSRPSWPGAAATADRRDRGDMSQRNTCRAAAPAAARRPSATPCRLGPAVGRVAQRQLGGDQRLRPGRDRR